MRHEVGDHGGDELFVGSAKIGMEEIRQRHDDSGPGHLANQLDVAGISQLFPRLVDPILRGSRLTHLEEIRDEARTPIRQFLLTRQMLGGNVQKDTHP